MQKTNNIVSYYFINIIIWIVAYFLLSLLQFENNTLSISQILNYSIWSGVFIGFFWGSIFKINIFIRNKLPNYFTRVTFIVITITTSAFMLAFFLYFLNQFIDLKKIPDSLNQLHQFYRSRVFIVLLTHAFIVALLYQFVYEMDKKLGQGVLLNFLLGKYINPREELRAFLFIDLKSSSFYAEKLGHFKYSKLAQDCFNHLSGAVIKNKAQIYQFVGDEVVLTWKVNKHFNPNYCIQCFLDFTNKLNSKKEYYYENYKLLPVFKAGIHIGKVMVTQVGQPKSEIAYHGDAINIASRIQGLCNKYKAKLLLTSDFIKLLNPENQHLKNISSLGRVSLKGKESPVNLHQLNIKI